LHVTITRETFPARLLAAGSMAVLLLAGAAGPVGAQPASARAFAQTVVRQLNSADGVPAASIDASLRRLLDENHDLAGRRLGGYDFRADPVCQCEEQGERYRLVSVTEQGRIGAQARVHIGGDNAHTYTLVFRQAGGRWIIWDAVNEIGSARTIATRHNACMRRLTGEDAIRRCFGD
jgi:hypothetical protein